MRTTILAAAAAVSTAGMAQAQMYGHDLKAEWHFGGLGTAIESHTVTAGPDIELPWSVIVNDDKYDIDIGEDTVSFIFNDGAFWTPNGFNGWYFEDLNNTLPEIIGFELLSHDPVVTPVIDAGWNENAFWVNLQNTQISEPGTFTMQVHFVPTPAAAATLGLGALATLRRRR